MQTTLHPDNDTDPQDIWFLSGGGSYGAYTAGCAMADATHNTRLPALFMVTSAGLPNALSRVVAEHRILETEAREGRRLTQAERSTIIIGCYQHLWDMVVKHTQTYSPQTNGMFHTMADTLIDNSEQYLPYIASAVATVVNIGNSFVHEMCKAAPCFMLKPWETLVSMQPFGLADFLRGVFPDVDAALDRNLTRIIANSYNLATERSVYLDSTKDPLEQMVASMTILGQSPHIGGKVDGGNTGFNGDFFYKLEDLVKENPAYADMRVTFINLGTADLAKPEIMKKINPHFAVNLASVAPDKAWMQSHWACREIALDRQKWPGGKAKLQATPEMIAALIKEGREAEAAHRTFSVPSEGPYRPGISSRSRSALRAA